MRLTKFRIYNYKSIIDSGYCDLASDITILIGKNESGKTATLEALRDFDQSAPPIPQSAIPLDENGKLPRLEMHFEINPSDIETIQSLSANLLSEEIAAHILKVGLTITKDNHSRYQLADQSLSQLFEEGNEAQSNNDTEHLYQIKSAKERISSLLERENLPEFNLDSSAEEIQKNAKELMIFIKSFLPSFHDENKKNEIVESIRLIMQETNKLTGHGISKQEKFLNRVIQMMPRFIYFSEFIGPFPFEVPISRIKETEPLLDFAKITGLNLNDVINTQDVQKRINTLNRHSAVISGDFGDHWQQNQIELVIKTDGDKIIFGIKEKDKTDFFKVEQRSKGFQWFLLFYLRISARASENNIILIDEPGTNLHAKAQSEILKILEKKSASQAQIILSTHSSYLIDPLRLDRVRLIIKNPHKGSILHNHIHEDLDADTLMPVTTASRKAPVATVAVTAPSTEPLPGPSAIVTPAVTPPAPLPLTEEHNILVIDLADYYFLDALKKFMKIPNEKEINLLPCPEYEQNLDQLVSLINGFDFDFRVVFSRRISGEDKRKYLVEKLKLPEGKIVNLPLDLGIAMEDFFSHNDFYTHVVQSKTNLDKTASHSLYFESKNIDCILAAKVFHEKVMADSINLSDETLENFQSIFNRILAHRRPSVLSIGEPQEGIRKKFSDKLREELKKDFNEKQNPQDTTQRPDSWSPTRST